MLLTPAGDSPFSAVNNHNSKGSNISASSVVSTPFSATSTVQSSYEYEDDFTSASGDEDYVEDEDEDDDSVITGDKSRY